MESRIRQICGFTDHFWYPEINKHLKAVMNHPQPFVELNLNNLYKKQPNTFVNEIKILILKILHDLKSFFSAEYRRNFEYSVEVLSQSEQKIKAAHILQKAGKQYIFQERLKQNIVKRREKEEEEKRLAKLEEEKWNKAIDACKRFRQANKTHKQYISLRNEIRQNEKTVGAEVAIINILTQYHECKSTIKELDEKKPKGFMAYFKGENAQSKEVRKNMIENLEKLDNQIVYNTFINDDFKNNIKNNEIPKVLEEINKEKKNHEKIIQEYEKRIAKTRTEVLAMLPA